MAGRPADPAPPAPPEYSTVAAASAAALVAAAAAAAWLPGTHNASDVLAIGVFTPSAVSALRGAAASPEGAVLVNEVVVHEVSPRGSRKRRGRAGGTCAV